MAPVLIINNTSSVTKFDMFYVMYYPLLIK